MSSARESLDTGSCWSSFDESDASLSGVSLFLVPDRTGHVEVTGAHCPGQFTKKHLGQVPWASQSASDPPHWLL